MTEKNYPLRLSLFIIAVAGKLTGEQLRECCNVQHDNGWHPENPELDAHQRRTIEWIMADDTMAEQYGYERSQGLEQLREAQMKCHWALKAITDRGDYDLSGYIRSAEWSLQNLRGDFDKAVKDLEEAIKNPAPVPSGPDKP